MLVCCCCYCCCCCFCSCFCCVLLRADVTLFAVAVAIKFYHCCYPGPPLRRRTPHEDGSGWTYRKTCGCALCTGTKRFSRWELGAENHLPRLPPPTPLPPPPARNFITLNASGMPCKPQGSLTSRMHPVRPCQPGGGKGFDSVYICSHDGDANKKIGT